ncbi:MAG: hypothetical protein IJW24_03025 [Clostridia bacterium]|nr:hypothetical protein [Clostridia bacterium]
MKIAVIGAKGKLGSSITNELHTCGHEVIEIDKINQSEHQDWSNADAAIDASHHKNTLSVAKTCKRSGIPLLVACTGHSAKELSKIKKTLDSVPHEFCPNLSAGMNFVFETLALVPQDFLISATIFEQHHKTKKDTPSGTAKHLKNIVDEISQTPTEIVSSRFSKALGTHKITLEFLDETVTIEHNIRSRNAFAMGAVKKIENLKNCQGNLDVMSDITGQNHEQN